MYDHPSFIREFPVEQVKLSVCRYKYIYIFINIVFKLSEKSERKIESEKKKRIEERSVALAK